MNNKPLMNMRFRGFLPTIIDVETGGFNANTDALLEISAITIGMDNKGNIFPEDNLAYHVKPFKGGNIDQVAIDFIGIDPFHPLRIDYDENKVMNDIFSMVRKAIKKYECTRAILVGHNSSFDLNFINACTERNHLKNNPFHNFSSFDTASLAGLVYGQTVLSRACKIAGIEFDSNNAHSAKYDANKTAELFCTIVNYWKSLGGWPVS